MSKKRLRGRSGTEATDIHTIMSTYKEWAFNQAPFLTFDKFIEKTEKLSSKPLVKATLGKYASMASFLIASHLHLTLCLYEYIIYKVIFGRRKLSE